MDVLETALNSSGTKKYTVVGAIDFGTSRSGYAYAFTADPTRIYDDQAFGTESRNLKTKTALLMKRNSSKKLVFHKFGFAAEQEYTSGDLEDDSDDDDSQAAEPEYEYFDRIKMNLHEPEGSTVYVTSASGKTRAPIESIIGSCLRHIKEKILHEVNKSSPESKITSKDVLWVLTVPCIWSPAAKQRMRKAAQIAGLTDPSNESHLILALEPEAAAIDCRFFVKNTHQTDLKTGEKILVVDAGGGTIDIFASRVVNVSNTATSSYFSMAELLTPSGGPWGSTYVDQAFLEFLNELLGDTLYAKFAKSNPSEHLAIRNKFIARKESFTLNDSDRITLKCPELVQFLSDLADDEDDDSITLKELVNEFNTKNPHFELELKKGNRLRFTKTHFQSFFDELINETLTHVKELITRVELKNLNYVFLVGGFGESDLLQHALTSNIQSKSIKVICPMNPDLAVVRGAVRFGLDPAAVTSRKSRKSYGIGSSVPFDSTRHPEERKVTNYDGEVLANGIFDKFVSAGQDIRVGHVVRRRYEPLSSKSDSIVLTIYESDDPDVQYTTDNPDAKVCATLKVQFSPEDLKTLPFSKRKVDVELLFGGSEIIVLAKLIATQREVSCTIDFTS